MVRYVVYVDRYVGLIFVEKIYSYMQIWELVFLFKRDYKFW